VNPEDVINNFWISEWTQMSISEPFQYWNDSFQSNIFSSDIGITNVNVGYQILPTLRSMSMLTYENGPLESEIRLGKEGGNRFICSGI
jgi:hypothetical protein